MKNPSKSKKNILYESGFSGRMIELEILIDAGEYGRKEIKELMTLYVRAIDHFHA